MEELKDFAAALAIYALIVSIFTLCSGIIYFLIPSCVALAIAIILLIIQLDQDDKKSDK